MIKHHLILMFCLLCNSAFTQDTLKRKENFALQLNGGVSLEFGQTKGIKNSSLGTTPIRESQVDVSTSLFWRRFRFGMNVLVYTSSVLFDGKSDKFYLFTDVAYRVNNEKAKIYFSPFVYLGKHFARPTEPNWRLFSGPLFGFGFGLDKYWNKLGVFGRFAAHRYTSVGTDPNRFASRPGIGVIAINAITIRFGLCLKIGL